MMEQVIVNILENAVQHAAGMKSLTLRVFTLGNQAIFEIRDDGCGIDPKKLDTIFTGCCTAKNEIADGQKRNAGIGLSVCATAMTLYASYLPDLILLDLGLPDMDGMKFLQFVRREDPTPIIVLSARSTENDKVSALDMGANDYVTKPFSSAELLARIRSALRSNRAGGAESRLPGGQICSQGAGDRLRCPPGISRGRGNQADPDGV
jgi:CheY-like chemotaxis protein